MLFRSLDIITEKLERMAEALDAAQYDERVVQDGDTYSIVRFPKEGNGGLDLYDYERQPIGEIIARAIPTRATALSLAREKSLLRTLAAARDEFTRKTPRLTHFKMKYEEEVLCEVALQLGENAGMRRDADPNMAALREALTENEQQAKSPKKGR